MQLIEENKEVKILPFDVYCQEMQTIRKRKVYTILCLFFCELIIGILFSKLIIKHDFQYRVVREFQNRVNDEIELTTGVYRGETDFGYFFGEGTFLFESGASYEGKWNDGLMEGSGEFKIPSEGNYNGEFINSQKHGKGIFTWDDGTVYEGEWKNDKMWGQGKYLTPAGVIYDGTFKENMFESGTCAYVNNTGKYTLFYSDGNISNSEIVFTDGTKYTGECEKSCISGTGTMEYTNGDKYVGEFLEGKKSGTGVYKWKSGDKYDGEWEADKMSGTGTYKYKNGVKASGTFENNLFVKGTYKIKNNFGRYVFTINNSKATYVEMKLKSGTKYIGDMKNGKLTGYAQIKYNNGDTYSGQVVRGKKSGQGEYKWKNGASYDGDWKKDTMNGRGVYLYPRKSKGYSLTGKFKKGYPSGMCTYETDDYDEYKTKWSNGNCVKVYE